MCRWSVTIYAIFSCSFVHDTVSAVRPLVDTDFRWMVLDLVNVKSSRVEVTSTRNQVDSHKVNLISNLKEMLLSSSLE